MLVFIPCLEHETSRPILPIQADFLLLQHAERFAREILAVDFFGVENVAQFVAGRCFSDILFSVLRNALLCGIVAAFAFN